MFYNIKGFQQLLCVSSEQNHSCKVYIWSVTHLG